MKKNIKLPYEIINKIPKNSFANIFINKYSNFSIQSDKLDYKFRDIYLQIILSQIQPNIKSEIILSQIQPNIKSELKYLISSYFVIEDNNNTIYDLILNFKYKKYIVNEHLLLDSEKSKKCKNCYVWNYRINLTIPSTNEKIFFEENKCGSKLLLSNKSPQIITNLYNELK